MISDSKNCTRNFAKHDFILPAVKQNALRELLLIGVFLIYLIVLHLK